MYASEIGKVMAASASDQRVYAEDQKLNAPRSLTSVPGMITQAAEVQKHAVDRLQRIDGLAARATNIAVRMTGPYPLPHPDRVPATSGETSSEPSSALDMLQRTIGEAHRPLSAMDDPFERLASAFDALERALN